MHFLPSSTSPRDLAEALRDPGYAIVEPPALAAALGLGLDALLDLTALWDDLPADGYLRDGGRYRRRRHSCFIVDPADVRNPGDPREISAPAVRAVAPRSHWQPVEYNALHGGLERWFEPLDARLVDAPAWSTLLRWLGETCSVVKGARAWFVEAHQFRIDTTDGIGRPTPEGAHRDGVDFVAVVLVSRLGVKGGETRVFEADGPRGIRFTMSEPWTLLMLDDARVLHESTPIQPASASAFGGHRDTLVLTFRAGGFQGAQESATASLRKTAVDA